MTFLDAGKYATYVFAAYGLSAAVILAVLADTLARARCWRRAAEREGKAPRPPERA